MGELFPFCQGGTAKLRTDLVQFRIIGSVFSES